MKTFPFIYNQPKDFVKSLQPGEWAEFLLSEINPKLSLSTIKAKVVKITEETADTKTFVLNPNWLWKGFSAGQHLPVTVEIAGRNVTRFYSLSSSPKEKLISITVKRQKGGLVSNYLNEKVKVGDILELGKPSGEFTIGEPSESAPESLLFLAGGSGITPIHSILKKLEASSYKGKATLLYFVRTSADIILKSSLEKIQEKNEFLKIQYILSDEKKEGYDSGFLTDEIVKKYVPNLEGVSVYVCGPGPMQQKALTLFPNNPIKSELFLLPTQIQNPVKKEGTVEVTLSLSHKTIQLKGEKSLLDELEEQGIFPQSGCRMGICHTCVCKKTSGLVTDLSNGEKSELGEENIQLCVSRAENALELEL